MAAGSLEILLLPSGGTLARGPAKGVSPEVLDISVASAAVNPGEPVSIFAQLPESAKLVRTSRSPTGQVEQWVRLDFPLERDETVVVDFRLP